MSGAEGIAGLAVGAIGLTALFTTCIDAFNIVVTAREFGHDYEVLCADLALQRLRFCLWGEAVGLVSRDAVHPQVHLPRLDDPQIKSTLLQTLQAIQYLLNETDRTRGWFSSRSRSSRGLGLFRDTFNQFGLRTARDRRQTSVAAVTKWAIYSGDKFRERIDRLKSLIDGLENVSKSLGVLDIQRSRMRTEIESLDDIEGLRLIREASVYSQRDLSDTASHRLLAIETSSAIDQVPPSDPSIYTAEESQYGGIDPDNPLSLQILRSVLDSSWQQSFYTALDSEYGGIDQSNALSLQSLGGMLDSSLQSSVPQNSRMIANLVNDAVRSRNWTTGPKTDAYGAKLKAFDIHDMAGFGIFPTSLSYLRETLPKLAEKQNLWDTETSMTNSKDLPSSNRDKLFYKRMTKELQFFRNHASLWTAWSPINFQLNHLLAGIEGPPDTPYEGGVFWIEIRMPEEYPLEAPTYRFLARIYHPNIDCRGQICLDILDKQWSPLYYTDNILTCICSILDDPGLTDPLVPEIAEIYCKDYDLYYRNAQAYTARYAIAEPRHKDGEDLIGETQQCPDSIGPQAPNALPSSSQT